LIALRTVKALKIGRDTIGKTDSSVAVFLDIPGKDTVWHTFGQQGDNLGIGSEKRPKCRVAVENTREERARGH
jgi:hypothetical protein